MTIKPGDPGVPMGAPPSWMAAAEKQDGQCGAFTTVSRGINGKMKRCNSTLRGGHKLYMWEGILMCATHYDRAKRAPKPGEVVVRPRKNGQGREGRN